MSKKNRYSLIKELIGLNEVESVFLKKYKWIFRRQSTADVGIDAQVELLDQEYNPTAQFIALQIKKGNSHLYLNKANAKLSHYVSSEHYEYWTNSAIPVLFTVALDDGIIYWQYASDESLYKKLKDSYRLDIPPQNTLTLESKEHIEYIVMGHSNQLKLDSRLQEVSNDIMEYNSEINYIINRINETFQNITNNTIIYTTNTNILVEKAKQMFSKKKHSQVNKNILNVFIKNINNKYKIEIIALSNRDNTEIEMAKEHFENIKILMVRKREILDKKFENKILESFLITPEYNKLYGSLEKVIRSTKLIRDSIQEPFPLSDSSFKAAQKNSAAIFDKLLKLLNQMKDLFEEEIKTYK